MPTTQDNLSRLDLTHEMPGGFISDSAYKEALGSMILVCTDVLIVDADSSHAAWLAYRKAKPMSEEWWFIGGRRRAGETKVESAQRCFKRETGLDIRTHRFVEIDEHEYIFPDRQQEPQEVGTHTLSHIFVIELTREDIGKAGAKLDPNEYDLGWGLRAFDEAALYQHQVHGTILKVYRKYIEEIRPRLYRTNKIKGHQSR